MDLVTHVLTGVLINKLDRYKGSLPLTATLLGTILPDTGEILIQKSLAMKYGERIAVYDSRTSDAAIASDLSITWLYDLLHSPIFSTILLGIGFLMLNKCRRKELSLIGVFVSRLAVGLLSHTLLDISTHGKVWALKLLFPLSQKRFPLFSDEIGNWWDWNPKLELPLSGFSFPFICLIIWILLTVLILIAKRTNIKYFG